MRIRFEPTAVPTTERVLAVGPGALLVGHIARDDNETAPWHLVDVALNMTVLRAATRAKIAEAARFYFAHREPFDDGPGAA